MSDGTRSAKPKTKKTKKANKPKWDALDADGRERPRFLKSFPRQPELDQLVKAFEAGDFERVREGAPKLARESKDPSVRRAAQELSNRIKPDPLLKYLLLMSFLLLVYLTLFVYFGNTH